MKRPTLSTTRDAIAVAAFIAMLTGLWWLAPWLSLTVGGALTLTGTIYGTVKDTPP